MKKKISEPSAAMMPLAQMERAAAAVSLVVM